MADLAYLRVSTTDQETDRQLADSGLQFLRVFSDKVSGKDTERPGLADLFKAVRSGDTVHVHSIDRLARNLRDLCDIVQKLTNEGASVRFHKENLTFRPDQEDPFAKMMLHVIGACAEFERAMIKGRQSEGIAKAKTKGIYKGRPASIDAAQVVELLDSGLGPTEIAQRLGISRQSVYRLAKPGTAA
ncbi:resolvase [Pseudomonas sp. 1239]|uniref:recombinase family protein n=1 Tax=unclassified Pseudomonas TaxID=196821 RepID=UPI000B4F24BB|nr:recombinase family protein [Pseudomonas sp. 1239]OUM22329.1 resolvase [Pseudomonas sp. 1239]